jgi:hypothetical protein
VVEEAVLLLEGHKHQLLLRVVVVVEVLPKQMLVVMLQYQLPVKPGQALVQLVTMLVGLAGLMVVVVVLVYMVVVVVD